MHGMSRTATAMHTYGGVNKSESIVEIEFPVYPAGLVLETAIHPLKRLFQGCNQPIFSPKKQLFHSSLWFTKGGIL